MLTSSAGMYESSGSQFLRTITGIKPVSDNFEESRLITTFLTNLAITRILYIFSLVLEGKAGKEIPESSRVEFLGKISANNFVLSYAEDSTLGPLNREGVADCISLLITLLAIRQKSHETSF